MGGQVSFVLLNLTSTAQFDCLKLVFSRSLCSDVGWVVGHSFSNYGPLIAGATTLLYEGKPVGTPDAAQFWRLIERHRVKTLFTAPTGLRGIKRVDPQGELVKKFDISSLETLFVAGERADTDTLKWAEDSTGVRIFCAPLSRSL